MRSTGEWIAAVLAVGLVAALTPAGSVAVAQERGLQPPVMEPVRTPTAAPTPVPAAVGPVTRAVTLITGDRVDVAERAGRLDVVRIARGPNRTNVLFTTDHAGGRLHVTPSDALPLLRANRVDPRLFDLTTLVEFGYDDTRADLPLIVTGDAGGLQNRAGASTARRLPGATALKVPKNGVADVWRGFSTDPAVRANGSSKMWLDGWRRPVLADSVPQVGAPAAWAAGFTGVGVTVGLVDSGVDATHPDLAGRVADARNFVDDGDDKDRTGHGTHVAATIAGTGTDGAHRGVAPGARLVSARVCNVEVKCPESAVLAGMQWVVDRGAKVVNMSLGGPDTPERDILEETVDRITAETGVLFVVAAGNSGKGGESTVGSPGSADSALTVGAVSKADELADFSSRGPRLGDDALKPDLTAPGVGIVAAHSRDAANHDPTNPRVALSGTSMATPHVAGAAAVLLQRHPDWRGAQLKAALMGSARTHPEIGVYDQGAGRLDLARGIRQTVLADPPSISVQDLWPLEKPIQRTVTYRNTGAEPVTLALDVRTTAPKEMFAVSARQVTVPAGSTADLRFTINTRAPGAATRNVGYLVATAGDHTVTTPFVVAMDTEATYAVDLTHLNRAGKPALDYVTLLVDSQRHEFFRVVQPTTRIRLPKGRYSLVTAIQDEFGPDGRLSVLVQPVLVLDRDTSVTMDARTARPVSVRVPHLDAEVVQAYVAATVDGAVGGLVSYEGWWRPDKLFVGPVGAVQRNPLVHGNLSFVLGKRGVPMPESPFVAHVAWQERGRMFPGLNRSVDRRDLAVVRADYARHKLSEVDVQIAARWPGRPPATLNQAPMRVPGSRLEYFNTDDGVMRQFTLIDADEENTWRTDLSSPEQTFTAGAQYHERRNAGVYGPGFTDPPFNELGWISRSEDTVVIQPTLLNDSQNWAGFQRTGGRTLVTLDRDGVRLFQRATLGAVVKVPAGTGTFQLSADLTADDPQALSTRVTCAWTFRSGTTSADRWTPLPLSAVRFRPTLDRDNTAPSGGLFAIPFEVQRQPGSSARPARRVVVEVSLDDGKTWREVPVLRYQQHGVVLVRHPAGPGFVSLRAKSVDTAGNTLEQTILRAYRIA